MTTSLYQWGQQRLLNEHVCCAAIAFKMSEWVEQESGSDFALSLNIPLQKLLGGFRTLQPWATGDRQLHHDNVPPHTSHLMRFFGETSNHPGDSAPLQPRINTLRLLTFPKTKIIFEREISDHGWRSGKHDGAADGDWENCVRSQSAYFEGDWGVIVLCTMSLVSCTFFDKCLYFSCYMTGYLLERSDDTVPWFLI